MVVMVIVEIGLRPVVTAIGSAVPFLSREFPLSYVMASSQKAILTFLVGCWASDPFLGGQRHSKLNASRLHFLRTNSGR